MNAVEKHVLRLIGENVDDPDVFTDDATGMAQIRGSINDAIQEICMLTNSYIKTYLLNIREEKQFYRITAVQDYFGIVLGVTDRARRRELVSVSINSMSHLDARFMFTRGEPEFFGQIGENHMFIAPRPSAEGKTLEVRAAMVPKAYTRDTDRIKVRDDYVNATVYLAVSEYYASTGNAMRATQYFEDYAKAAGFMELTPKNQDEVRQMVTQSPYAWTRKNREFLRE